MTVQLFRQSEWLGDLTARHNDADDLFHLDLFAPVCIAYKLDQGNDMFFVALSNPYMLHVHAKCQDYMRTINDGFSSEDTVEEALDKLEDRKSVV